jgi:hypothetical protein
MNLNLDEIMAELDKEDRDKEAVLAKRQADKANYPQCPNAIDWFWQTLGKPLNLEIWKRAMSELVGVASKEVMITRIICSFHYATRDFCKAFGYNVEKPDHPCAVADKEYDTDDFRRFLESVMF